MLNSSLCYHETNDHIHNNTDHGHNHGRGNYQNLDNNNTLTLIGFSVSIIAIMIFLIGEYDFLFIAYNYSEKRCINHAMLITIGWLNLCEVIASLFVFYNSRRIIQYLKDLLTSLRTYGSQEIDMQNNLNPTKNMLKHVGIFYSLFIVIEIIPSLWMAWNNQMVQNECLSYWTQTGPRIVFIVFRIMECILGSGLFFGFTIMCLKNVAKGCKKCCVVCIKRKIYGDKYDPNGNQNIDPSYPDEDTQDFEARMIR